MSTLEIIAVCYLTVTASFGSFVIGIMFLEWFLITKRKGLLIAFIRNRDEFEQWLDSQPKWKSEATK